MSNVQDGLVFVDLEYDGGAMESFNVSAITRIRQLSVMGIQEDIITC